MMRLTDATKLATTKLRTRKVRLVVTIVIAGLMFSTLAATSMVGRGIFDSLSSFNREAFGDRYIVSAQDHNSYQSLLTKPEIVERTIAIQKDMVARKTAEAKRLGITYDAKNEPAVVNDSDTPQGKQRIVDITSQAGRQALKEYRTTHPAPGKAELAASAESYGPISFYESRNLNIGSPDGPNLTLINEGKEDYGVTQNNGPTQQAGLDSFTAGWTLMSRDLFKPFLLPGAATTIGQDGSIPVVAPLSAIEQLTGLKSLSANASPQERLERLRQVRANTDQVSFEVCYRNQTAADQLNQAIEQQREIAQNKDDKNYVKPKLAYSLPTKPCTTPAITSDTRSDADKQQTAKREQFEAAFGKPAAEQTLLKFRVVGIAPDLPDFSAPGLTVLISLIVSSNLGGASWLTPVELINQQPQLANIFDSSSNPAPLGSQYVELADADKAGAFLKEQSCQPDPTSQVDPLDNCAEQGKYFILSPFGSNSLALNEARRIFVKVFGYAAVAIALIATVIMIGTVGRIIADSRRETAVFRAIGAKKLDIIQIYMIYSLFLSLMIFVFSIAAGLLVALIANSAYAPDFTVQALVAFNAQNLDRTFSLYQIYWPDLGRLLALALVGGLLSASLPLLRNLRRNPIRDMRDDT